MPMQFSFVDDWKDLRSILPRNGNDFWLSSMAGVYAIAVPDKLLSVKIEDLYVEESGYTHCYIAKSGDAKADANRLLDEFGLGMRKKRAGGADGKPGSVWALVTRGGPSVLCRRRAGLSGNDRTLSTEERLRRTTLKFTTVNLEQLRMHAEANQDAFYLTSWSGVDAEVCKKRVMALQVEKDQGTMAAERFSICLIAETRNCKDATKHINLHCGLGCRSTAVRSRHQAGCVVLLLPDGPLALEAAATAAPPAATGAVAKATGEDSDSESSSSSSSSSPSREALPPLDLSKELEKSIDELLLPLLELEEEEVEEAEKAVAESGHAPATSSSAPAANISRRTQPMAIEDGTKSSGALVVSSAAAAEAEATELVPFSRGLSQASQAGQMLRGGRWDEIPLACILLNDWTEVADILRGHGHDFYLSSRACRNGSDDSRTCSPLEELANAVASLRIEDTLIADMFSHCYIAESRDMRADVDSVIREFGLGLRKSLSRSRPDTSGYVFVLVNTNGQTSILKKQLELPSTARSLSTEVRVRRTSLRFEMSSVAEMLTQSRKNQGSFYLTAIKKADVETCKKKVVTTQVDGAFVEERFPRCLIAEAPNCLEATSHIEAQCGLGIRISKVRSKPVKGCLALFLPMEFKAQDSGGIVPVSRQAGNSIATPDSKRHREVWKTGNGVAASASVVATPQKSQQVSAASMVAATSVGPRSSSIAPAVLAIKDGASRKRPRDDDSNSLHQQQVSVLEGRMKVLLPLLLPAELNTNFVQARLEELMHMPQGRLAKFQPVIQRAVHSFVTGGGKQKFAHGGQLN